MFIFLLGFWGYQQGEVFNINSNSYPAEEEKTEITVNVPNENYHYERNFKQEALLLKELMKKKPYLEPSLTYSLTENLDFSILGQSFTGKFTAGTTQTYNFTFLKMKWNFC